MENLSAITHESARAVMTTVWWSAEKDCKQHTHLYLTEYFTLKTAPKLQLS